MGTSRKTEVVEELWLMGMGFKRILFRRFLLSDVSGMEMGQRCKSMIRVFCYFCLFTISDNLNIGISL